ncbi:MAG: 23S rRNA pseudouridine(1911/1915/1917) synthase RluD [Gammaproteobacteria bacterium]|nr:23S rRNA pseudouridine(1911/1915/1917) synthase RluD [Gammaproteobacteria bacterium]
MSSTRIHHVLQLPPAVAGRRLDQALAAALPQHSRTRLRRWIDGGRILVDGRVLRARDPVAGGELVLVDAVLDDLVEPRPQALDLTLRWQDPDLYVVDKPAGLVVHPGAGNPDRTLQNALLALDPALAGLPRAGIVHRLDKDTSGLLLVARTELAQRRLTAALAARAIHREYHAICAGVLTGGGTIDAPIDRHPVNRVRMSVRAGGRPAVTHYRVIERFRAHTWVRVLLETGRTHQIRLHLAHAGWPLVGDPVYGGRLRLPPAVTPELRAALRGFRRQALHAAKLVFPHPCAGRQIEVSAPLPEDFSALLAALRDDARRGGAGDGP